MSGQGRDYVSGSAASRFYGKHRLAAAVAHLHNQIDFLEKEIDQVEVVGEACLVCHHLISSVESIPDPLLPMTLSGEHGVGWDRWFKATHNSTSFKRWI